MLSSMTGDRSLLLIKTSTEYNIKGRRVFVFNQCFFSLSPHNNASWFFSVVILRYNLPLVCDFFVLMFVSSTSIHKFSSSSLSSFWRKFSGFRRYFSVVNEYSKLCVCHHQRKKNTCGIYFSTSGMSIFW